MKALTSLLLHVLALDTLIEQADPKADIDTHALLIDLTCDPILDENIGRVRTEPVASI